MAAGGFFNFDPKLLKSIPAQRIFR